MSLYKDTLLLLDGIALEHGALLKVPQSLLPLHIKMNARSEFDQGVLSCVAHMYDMICRSEEGRQAVHDLGFQPIFQDVERPGHEGRSV